MNSTLQTGSWRVRDQGPGANRPQPPWIAQLFVGLLVAGYLLFAHGCHGDEDNELWALTEQGVSGHLLDGGLHH